MGALLNGWTLTGFHRIQSGSPLVFTTGSDVAQNGILQPNGQYPLLVSGTTADDLRRDHSSTSDMIAQYFNTAAFVPLNSIPRGIYGDARRGLIYGPADGPATLRSCATSILAPDLRLQLRGEFFNAFNQVNFNNPNTQLSSSPRSDGSPAPAPGRVIQLAAKVIW